MLTQGGCVKPSESYQQPLGLSLSGLFFHPFFSLAGRGHLLF